MQGVLISVCIAVYNAENYIEKCLDSVLGQDFNDYEIILIDNGSDDRSIEICEKYYSKYPEIIHFYTLPKPTQMGRAYYECIRKMNGLYHLSIDSDDYLCPGALKNIAEAIKKSKADLIMGTFICEVEEGAVNFKDAEMEADKINSVPYEQAIQYITSLNNFHTVQWRFIQKVKTDNTFLEYYIDKKEFDVGGLAGSVGDTLNVLTILRNARSIYYLEEPFYVYRKHKSSITYDCLNENIIINFLKFSLAAAGVIKAMSSQDEAVLKEWLEKQQLVKFSIFKYGIHLLSYEKRNLVCRIIRKDKQLFDIWPQYGSDDMKELHRCMQSEGMENGLERYMLKVNTSILNKLKKKEDQSIVIFPTGTMAASLERLLAVQGFYVNAYIDNDEKKDGIVFYGKSCYLPYKYINSWNAYKKELYIISTIYPDLRQELKMQLLGYGIEDGNILIWE